MGICYSKAKTQKTLETSTESGFFFTTLGTFVVDEIHYPNGHVEEEVPGGSGTYGMSIHRQR